MHTQFIPCIIPSYQTSRSEIECLARRNEDAVDGAYYDFFRLRGEVAAVIGDVESSGVAGAILSTGLQSSLRCMVRQGVDLRDAVSEVNRILWELAPDAVCGTIFSARVNASENSLRYINAGHHTAFVIRRDGRVEYLEPNAPPLALSQGSCYREVRIRFEPGDLLISASDDIDCRGRGSFVESGRIVESEALVNARIVIAVSYRAPEEGPAQRMAKIPAAPVLRAAA
jgi:serine phosphatase RsbU (regulator of sigma subunit)